MKLGPKKTKKTDLEELIDLIRTSDLGNQRNVAPPRPSKTRKMFASRACRKSVMIGDSLTKAQMRSILDHMGTMEEPWVSRSEGGWSPFSFFFFFFSSLFLLLVNHDFFFLFLIHFLEFGLSDLV